MSSLPSLNKLDCTAFSFIRTGQSSLDNNAAKQLHAWWVYEKDLPDLFTADVRGLGWMTQDCLFYIPVSQPAFLSTNVPASICKKEKEYMGE